MQVTMTVNGESVTREVEGRMLLVHFLRDELGLTGTHCGCDTTNCGTCVTWEAPRAHLPCRSRTGNRGERVMTEVLEDVEDADNAKTPLGHGRMLRKEAPRFTRGMGRYVDDLQLNGMLRLAILRSPVAHANIV